MCATLLQAKTLLESVVREVLLGRRFHGLLFHHHLLDGLLHHFLSHDFSVTCVRQGLQVSLPCLAYAFHSWQTNEEAPLRACSPRHAKRASMFFYHRICMQYLDERLPRSL